MDNYIVKEENMAQTGGYREELEHESKQTDPNSHASRLIAQEIERLNKGEDEIPHKKPASAIPFLDVHQERPQKISLKIRLPVSEFPRYNFVGKLLGPKGQTLKALQEQTGCKMAIMGRGSMRDKDKEEELRKEGGKYAHLEDDLHILVECYAELVDAYHRIAEAARELKKFVIPQMDDMYEGGEGGMNGAPMGRGRGGFRGGPIPDRGGRGSFRGGRGAGPPPPPARGGRGGGPPPPARGAPRGRGGPPPPVRGGGRGATPSNSSYDGYGSQGFGSGGGYESGYENYGGGQGYSGGGDSQFYEYGHSNSQNSGGYDSYSGYDYGDAWNSAGGKTSAQSGRGSSRGQTRSHPYSRPSGGNY